jgi:hypothetical protein
MSYQHSTGRTTATATASTGGFSIAGLLGVAFVVLKLTGVINWSWWLVLLPFYAGFALFLGIFVIGVIVILIGTGLDSLSAKKARKEREARLNKRV